MKPMAVPSAGSLTARNAHPTRPHRWLPTTALGLTVLVAGAGCGDSARTTASGAATCGNGLVETGEQCDLAIAAGPGTCPTACKDDVPCTEDLLVNGATCYAACTFAVITAATDGDGCCPESAAGPDSDCDALCGNGVLDDGERCDLAILTGPGACPSTCSDGLSCTTDLLTDAGTCRAVCTFPAITLPADDDGCCPSYATSNEDSDCPPLCGNAVVDTDELCDLAILTGPGACPTDCDDSDACPGDVLVDGSSCQATCTFGPITVPTEGDGCCPSGANHNTDSDCAPFCGNMVVEAGEVCDTAISTGPGACPTACSDDFGCTLDVLLDADTCQAACSFSAITLPANNDGCCPPGADNNTDSDCAPGCGNGVVEGGEVCDTAIPTGPDACPTTCTDGLICTADLLIDGGTCLAACSFPAITAPDEGDGCCPSGANHNTDSDCAPLCGNMVVEAGESCDDGNSDPDDGCDACAVPVVETAFRITDLDLRDPHFFLSVPFLGCRDVTDAPLFTYPSLNDSLQESIQTDGDSDGYFDLSLALIFRPYDQTPGETLPLELVYADCTAVAEPVCTPGVDSPTPLTSTNGTGGTACLAPDPATVYGYVPNVTASSAPCFSTSVTTVTLDMFGLPIVLTDARVAATYVGNPAREYTFSNTTLTAQLTAGISF